MDAKTMDRWMRRFSLFRKYIMDVDADDEVDIFYPRLDAEDVSDISVQKVDEALLLRGPLFGHYDYEFLILGTKGECEWLGGPDDGRKVMLQCDERYYWDDPDWSPHQRSSDFYPVSRALLSLVTNPEWSLRQIRHIVELRFDSISLEGVPDDRMVKITIHKWDPNNFSLEDLVKTHLMPSTADSK